MDRVLMSRRLADFHGEIGLLLADLGAAPLAPTEASSSSARGDSDGVDAAELGGIKQRIINLHDELTVFVSAMGDGAAAGPVPGASPTTVVSRGVYRRRAGAALATIGVRSALVDPVLGALESLWSVVHERTEHTLNSTTNRNAIVNLSVKLFELAAATPSAVSSNVIAAVNALGVSSGSGSKNGPENGPENGSENGSEDDDDDAVGPACAGVLALGCILGSSTLWSTVLGCLKREKVTAKTKVNRCGTYLSILDVAQRLVELQRDSAAGDVASISGNIAGMGHLVRSERKTLQKSVAADASADGATKQPTLVTKDDLLAEMAAWGVGLLVEVAKLAELLPAARRAAVSHGLLAAIVTCIAYGGVAMRPGGWVNATVREARAALADADTVITFERHKTSASHSAQQTVVGIPALLRAYLDTVRPALTAAPLSDDELPFVTITGRPVTSMAYEVRIAFEKQVLSVPRMRAAWAAERDQFTPTAFRKLFTDREMSEEELQTMAEAQCHSVKTMEQFYRRREGKKRKRHVAIRSAEMVGVRAAGGAAAQGARTPGGSEDGAPTDPAAIAVAREGAAATPVPPDVDGDDGGSVSSASSASGAGSSTATLPVTPRRSALSKIEVRAAWVKIESVLAAHHRRCVLDALRGIGGNSRRKELLVQLLNGSGAAQATARLLTTQQIQDKIKNDLKKLARRA
jgi:hypothetical protein